MVERIRELCREKGISILKLEMACGFSNGSVNKWSRQSPSADKLLTVASFFGVSMEYLWANDKVMTEIYTHIVTSDLESSLAKIKSFYSKRT